MNKTIFFLLLFLLSFIKSYAVVNYPRANDWTIHLARSLSKDIFELNGVPYLQPMVEVVNTTANARFFSSAFVPYTKNNFYIKLSVNGMLGFVPDSKKEYSPSLPIEPYDPENLATLVSKLSPYITIDYSSYPPKVNVRDTAGLIYMAFKLLMYDGVRKQKLQIPASAPTILGEGKKSLYFNRDTIRSLLNENPIFPLLPENLRDTIFKSIENFPENFDLPQGLNIQKIIAGMPQIEIGSLFGTELTLRYVPRIDLGSNIGKFTFWGIGLKHSLSQYIREPFVDFAIQIAYQGTNLQNTIGVTNAKLNANANFFNANFHFSKKLSKVFELFSGISYEYIHINTDFTYYLPITVQYQLGLIWLDDNGTPDNFSDDFFRKNPELGYNGDPFGSMNKNVIVNDKNLKLSVGFIINLGNFSSYFDYNFGKIDILSFGILYNFDLTKNK
ncbi:MAG: hypothetical protein N2560_04520 [Ignavibacteria bacterium]|nr:hypothetical protein [Ignavibacteria bacterium]